jgi:dissimilatory sulfite reductase (desulfoviridin) alpha/beta subunit
VDIGIIGAARPGIGAEPCTGCGACSDVCDETAITLDKKNVLPIIDQARCLLCAKCIRICPSGTLFEETSGFRVMLGGRLGRHPRLAMEIEGIFDHQGVLQIVKNCITFYKSHSKNGQRFAHLFSCLDPFVRNLPTA